MLRQLPLLQQPPAAFAKTTASASAAALAGAEAAVAEAEARGNLNGELAAFAASGTLIELVDVAASTQRDASKQQREVL